MASGLASVPDTTSESGHAALSSRRVTSGAVLDRIGGVSRPRPIYRGQLYMLTRRCSERRFFLKPSKKRDPQFEYCLAVAAKRHGIQVHAVMDMSNHWHCVATDPDGNMPAFLRDMHGWTARVFNSGLGRWEHFWSSAQTSLVRADTDDDVVERIAYAMANPVEAGLVAKGASWPGLRLCWPQQRKPVPRPKMFREAGPMPDEATLELVRPPGFAGMDDDALSQVITDAVLRREAYFRDKYQREGRPFLGRRAIRKQSAFDAPTSSAPRRQMSPRVAAKNKWRRIEMLQRLGAFADDYRAAFAMWRAGFRDVVFPRGTYAMRHLAGVAVAPD